MNYEITDERKQYLNARGYTILAACPGSGKTTSIVYKLREISEYCKVEYGKHTGFACLSFTNKACDEITNTFKIMHGEIVKFPNVVSTVDSFLTQNIVFPFWYLFPLCKSKPVVVNNSELLKHIYYHKSSPSMVFRRYYDLFFKYPPENIIINADGYFFGKKKINDTRTLEYCKKAVEIRFEKGIVTSQDVLYMAYYIIHNYKFIDTIIINRFPYIIVDEAQDNSLLQFELFIELRKNGLKNLEFVGDVCQSIYEFRDARPDYLINMIGSNEWNVLHFSECRRSNQRIIDLYSKLKPENIPEIHSYNVVDKEIPIIVYKYNDNNIKNVISDFIGICDNHNINVESRAVLARGESIKNKFITEEKNGFNYWKSDIPYLLIKTKQMINGFDYNSSLSLFRHVLALIKYNENQYLEQKNFLKEIENDIDFNVKILEFLKQIPELSLSFEDWTSKTQVLLKNFWNLPSVPDFMVYKRKNKVKISDIAKEKVCKFYYEKDVDIKNPINTIHSVKGASFDAVLLFLSKDSKGQNISLNDFPQIKITNMTEKQRMIYVACSRAKQFMALGLPDDIENCEIKKALRGIDFKLKELNIPGSLF